MQAHVNRCRPAKDPFWYQNGVVYEVHVRAFYDTDADGKGDFRGITEKLDYWHRFYSHQPSQ
jgi:pullulanase/glycogen debranching enzyme